MFWKCFWWFVIGLIIGALWGTAYHRQPTVHECVSVCMEYIPETYDTTVDYD